MEMKADSNGCVMDGAFTNPESIQRIGATYRQWRLAQNQGSQSYPTAYCVALGPLLPYSRLRAPLGK